MTKISNKIEVEDKGCVKNAVVYGLEDSIRRSKYPMSVNPDSLNSELTKGIEALAHSAAGSGHDQWLTGVIVQFDLTFTNKAWVEAERYHFLDFVSSQSTMHRITQMNPDDLYIDFVDPRIVDIMKEKINLYNTRIESGLTREQSTNLYLEILYSNPAGCKITAGMTTNYRQLKTIYKQRRSHRLPEWQEFCNWVESLPLSHLIL